MAVNRKNGLDRAAFDVTFRGPNWYGREFARHAESLWPNASNLMNVRGSESPLRRQKNDQ